MSIKPPSLEARVTALEARVTAHDARVIDLRLELNTMATATREDVLASFRDLTRYHTELETKIQTVQNEVQALRGEMHNAIQQSETRILVGMQESEERVLAAIQKMLQNP